MKLFKIQKWMMSVSVLLVFFICTAEECLAQSQKDINKEPSVMTYKKPNILKPPVDKTYSVDMLKVLQNESISLVKPIPTPIPLPPRPNPPCPQGNCLPSFLKMGQTIILVDATTKETVLMGMPDKSKPLGQGNYEIKYIGSNSSYKGNTIMTLTNHNQLTESIKLFDVSEGMLKQLF